MFTCLSKHTAEYTNAIHTISVREIDYGKLLMLRDGAKMVVPQSCQADKPAQARIFPTGINPPNNMHVTNATSSKKSCVLNLKVF